MLRLHPQGLKIPFHPPRSMPPDYRRWDFIPNRVTKHGRVLRAETHTVPHTLANCDALLAIVEERNVLLPWKANHDIQPLPISKIQEPQGRHCVCPDSIYSCIRDQKKIRLHTIAIMKFTSALVRPECSVRDSSDP